MTSFGVTTIYYKIQLFKELAVCFETNKDCEQPNNGNN